MALSHAQLCRLSAAFAISNMGQGIPADIGTAPLSKESPFLTPRSEVENWAGHLMETDEHEDIFAGEAEMWYKDLAKKEREEILQVWGAHSPWIQQIFDQQ